ncbi:MAG: HEPN domain-containing protein [Elusimicrobia bacterium]|nr:HEPN domain-containing protein [Elusimicrobiota bacterium]
MNALREELKLAFEMLSDAQLMYKENRLKSCVNRAYYAMFHATKAILLSQNMDCQSHAGALQRFGERVVKKGLIEKKFAKSLHRAYRLREKSDYSPAFKIELSEVTKLINETEE